MNHDTSQTHQDNSDESISIAIRKMISNNEFGEHEKITESELGRKLGASRTPVRMALKLLHSEGLLTKSDGRGYLARQFSEESMLHAAEVHGVLEGLAAQRMARSGLSSLNRERLEKSVDATATIINRGIIDKEAIEAFKVANLIFHRTIIQGCDNAFVEDSLRRLQIMLHNDTVEMLSLNSIIVSHSQHLVIKKSIESGDGGRAFNMMREHVNASTDNQETF